MTILNEVQFTCESLNKRILHEKPLKDIKKIANCMYVNKF